MRRRQVIKERNVNKFIDRAGFAKAFWFGLTALWMGSAIAEPAPMTDRLQDYSHALPVTVSGQQGVVGLRLPKSVYLHARSAQLNDVRLFDAAGAVLPFALYVPPMQTRVERSSISARIFPVTSSDVESATNDLTHRHRQSDFDLDIKMAADGTLVSVKNKAQRDSTRSEQLAALILDLGALEDGGKQQNFDALKFTLPAGTTHYSAQVWLEVSQDLRRWDSLGMTELNWLVNSDTQVLTNDRLEFNPRRFRYARLSWRRGQPLQFASIHAESANEVSNAPALENIVLSANSDAHAMGDAKQLGNKNANDLVYTAAIALPVEQINLQLSEKNVVMPAVLGQYREFPSRQIGKPSVWQFLPIAQSTFYQIQQDGQQRSSAALKLPVTHVAQWVVRPSGTYHSSAQTDKPKLALSWQPATLVFVASGKAPYTLAVGREGVGSSALELSQVAPGFSSADLSHLEQASLGDVQAQSGSVDAVNSASQAAASARQRLWILWGVLILGVGIAVILAWRLLTQMK
jgi:hypothetical protein